MCYGMMDCCEMYWKEGCWVQEQEEEEKLLEKKYYKNMMKGAEDMSVWRTVRKDLS